MSAPGPATGSASDSHAERWDITFRGDVQGVGFRYTTVRIAETYRVTGWVRNERDGSVRCIVEGALEELERFITAVEGAMGGCIREKSIARSAGTGEFRGFEIR